MSDDAAELAAKLRLALEMHDAGVELMRQNLRRAHPDESDAQVAARLQAWLLERPGAEHGDAAGVPGTWPRRRE